MIVRSGVEEKDREISRKLHEGHLSSGGIPHRAMNDFQRSVTAISLALLCTAGHQHRQVTPFCDHVTAFVCVPVRPHARSEQNEIDASM